MLDQVRLLQPTLHISGRFSAARHYAGVVLPLAWHPKNRNALIVCDLHFDPQPLLDMDAESLRKMLYTCRDELPDGQLPIPLKLIQINRCPVVAPLNVVRAKVGSTAFATGHGPSSGASAQPCRGPGSLARRWAPFMRMKTSRPVKIPSSNCTTALSAIETVACVSKSETVTRTIGQRYMAL